MQSSFPFEQTKSLSPATEHESAAGLGQAHEVIEVDHGRLDLYHQFLPPQAADRLFQHLQASLQWQQARIRMHGKEIPIPRLQAWYGDRDTAYGYSGIALDPLPWVSELQWLREQLNERFAEAFHTHFNSALCNLYRHGQDSVSWHADSESALGTNPVIASVSLGAVRRFQLKPRRGRREALSLDLPHNSVLIMSGALQHHWIHQVPKTRQTVGPRINLTFRRIVADAAGR